MALSQLNPQIIGAEMEHGFAGSYARQPDMIVVTRPVGEKEPLPFGMALMYDANGAVVLMQGSGVTADRFAGVAGREMRSALSYTDQNTGAYTTGDAGSVFQRGSINVLCQKGTPKRGGAVYVPDLGIPLVLAFDEGRVVGLVELPFHIREGRRQIIRVGWSESRTETVEAVPIDVALGSFRVDVLTVGEVETAVIVLGVIGAVASGSSVVSC